MTLPELLTKYLKDKGWVTKGAITAIEWYHKDKVRQYLPETVGRALRHLEEESIIAVKPDGISVQYKYIPADVRHKYRPWSTRLQDKDTLFRN